MVGFHSEYKESSSVWERDYCAKDLWSIFQIVWMEKSESIISLWLLVGRRGAVEGILHVSTLLCPCKRSFTNMHKGGSSLSQQLGYENGGCWHLLLRDQGAMSLTRKKVPAQMLFGPRWDILCPSNNSSQPLSLPTVHLGFSDSCL